MGKESSSDSGPWSWRSPNLCFGHTLDDGPVTDTFTKRGSPSTVDTRQSGFSHRNSDTSRPKGSLTQRLFRTRIRSGLCPTHSPTCTHPTRVPTWTCSSAGFHDWDSPLLDKRVVGRTTGSVGRLELWEDLPFRGGGVNRVQCTHNQYPSKDSPPGHPPLVRPTRE